MGSAYAKLERMKDIPAPAGTSTYRVQHATEDGITLAYGTTVPSDAATGFAPSSIFLHVDGAVGDKVRINEGTVASADFNALVTNYYSPVRALTTGDAWGIRLDCSDLFTGAGAAGPRTWGLYITGSKESGVIATAGADDAAIRVSVNNYVANEEIFNFRGLNVVAANRSGGVLGELNNIISVSAKSDSTNAKIWGLNVDAQSLSADTADEMIGLDVSFNREGGVSTEEAGVRIRTRGTINTAVNTAIRVSKDATDHGFINLFNIEADAVDVTAATVEAAHVLGFDGDGTAIKIPVVYNGVTYYLVAGTETALVADA